MAVHLMSGGFAGACEALACHPLDTIKVRMQGSVAAKVLNPPSIHWIHLILQNQNFIGVGVSIAQKEGFPALYKGLGAVVSGIVPKMAIRFSSFETYKGWLATPDGTNTSASVFLAGLGAGITESVLVVTPMDVIKIRLQAQRHSMTDPLDVPKYRNAAHCAFVMIKEEGPASLYKGVTLTALRQSTNQAANFTVYQYLKKRLSEAQGITESSLPWYQSMSAGFISGACGPLFNAPIDTIKTRIQKTPSKEKGWTRFVNVTRSIMVNEGWKAFYKGLTPRVLRVAPGQAITFMVCYWVSILASTYSWLGLRTCLRKIDCNEPVSESRGDWESRSCRAILWWCLIVDLFRPHLPFDIYKMKYNPSCIVVISLFCIRYKYKEGRALLMDLWMDFKTTLQGNNRVKALLSYIALLLTHFNCLVSRWEPMCVCREILRYNRLLAKECQTRHTRMHDKISCGYMRYPNISIKISGGICVFIWLSLSWESRVFWSRVKDDTVEIWSTEMYSNAINTV